MRPTSRDCGRIPIRAIRRLFLTCLRHRIWKCRAISVVSELENLLIDMILALQAGFRNLDASFDPKSSRGNGCNPIYRRRRLHPCRVWGHSKVQYRPRREELGGKRSKNGQNRRNRHSDYKSTPLDAIEAKYLQLNCTVSYPICWFGAWWHS